jgi:hypothetical protein
MIAQQLILADPSQSIFAPLRSVSSIDDCYFYHSVDIPGHGEVVGEWDLRGREREYLGHVDLAGKSVLEIGTASGYLCFWMEKQGAQVVAFDLSEEQDWDIVPFADRDFSEYVRSRKAHIRRINNGWWYARERFQSNARMVYGTVYDVSPRLGLFDVVTLGSILLHLRDPFLAMQKAASVARDTMVVTQVPLSAREQAIALLSNGRVVRFLPDARTGEPWETWWTLSPDFIIEVLQILGFSRITFSRHQQRYLDKDTEVYTIMARRGLPEGCSSDPRLSGRSVDDYTIHNEIMAAIPGRDVLRHLTRRILRRLLG